ncbi:MAG: hypothetical protein GY842_06755, partial [bacterium]|nr:hypothetical protein [bacterium]
IAAILTPLGFGVNDQGERMTIQVPSWRATKDVAMEADIIEEVARCVGYDNIDSCLPRATVRCFDPNAQHEVEQNTLREFCMNLGYNEIHRYLWYNDAWLAKLGYSPVPGIEVRNPITAQEHSLRHQLMPGMLEATDLNRHHWDAFRLIELGSVFPAGTTADAEHRHVGLISAQRKRDAEDGLLLRMKGDLETWAGQVFGRTATFSRVDGTDRLLWEHVHKSAEVRVGDVGIGTVGVLPLELRNRIDEHLKAWSIVWAELRIDHIAVPRPETRKLEPIPTHPQIDLDFSALTDASRDYVSVAGKVADFKHPLLVNVTYVGSYEGKSIPAGQRSLTFRTRIGDATRTLIDDDLNDFRQAFGAHLQKCGLVLRG